MPDEREPTNVVVYKTNINKAFMKLTQKNPPETGLVYNNIVSAITIVNELES